MHHRWRQTAAKKEQGHFKQRTLSQKSSASLMVVGWKGNGVVYIAFIESSKPIDELKAGTKLKKVYTKTKTKLIPLLQPEHKFCRQNGPERSQVQDWYPNEKIGDSSRMADVVLQTVWVLYRMNKNGDESLPLLLEEMFSIEDRSSSIHVGIRNVLSDDCYDDKNITRCHLKNKVVVRL